MTPFCCVVLKSYTGFLLNGYTVNATMRLLEVQWPQLSFCMTKSLIFKGQMKRDSRLIKPTLQAQLVVDLLGGARDKGLEDQYILDRAGLGGDVLSNPNTRVSLQIYYRLLSVVREELQDEMLGFLDKAIHPRAFPLLCDGGVGYPDIESFIGFANHLYGLLTNEFFWEIKRNSNLTGVSVAIRFKNGADWYRRFFIEFLMVTTYRTLSWLVGEHFPVRSVHFTFPRPEMIDKYHYLLSDRVLFNAEVNEFVFDSGVLSRPIIRNRGEVPSFLRSTVGWFLLNPESYPFTRKVRHLLLAVDMASGFPGFEAVSRKMNISHQHLWRKLNAEGTSYQQIKNQLRRDMAIYLLTDTKLTISEITARIGYHAERPFYRIFSRWTGMSPGEYRKIFSDRG